MSAKILELRRKRAGLVAQARGILDGAETEKRELSQEEQNSWDGLMDQVGGLGTAIDREERMGHLESDLDMPLGEVLRPEPGEGRGGRPYEFSSRSLAHLNEARLDARTARLASPEYARAFGEWVTNGGRVSSPEAARALQADNDTAGGYLYAPMQFVDRLIKNIDDVVYMRQWGTIIPVTGGESLGIPTLEADPADADWTSELLTGSEDSAMSFGRRELNPAPLAKRIKISRKLLSKVPSADALVRGRLEYKFGITFEKAGLTGNGARQPLGVFTASADGVPTSQDVSTGNTSTTVTFDGLTNAKYKLKAAYWPRARWLAHQDFYKEVTKLKDGNGQYLWRESVRVGEPDRLLGIPAFMSQYAPNTFTTGLYTAVLADFSQYWFADSLMFELQRLLELYAETNQVGMIGRLESDGMPVLAEAFVRVKLA